MSALFSASLSSGSRFRLIIMPSRLPPLSHISQILTLARQFLTQQRRPTFLARTSVSITLIRTRLRRRSEIVGEFRFAQCVPEGVGHPGCFVRSERVGLVVFVDAVARAARTHRSGADDTACGSAAESGAQHATLSIGTTFVSTVDRAAATDKRRAGSWSGGCGHHGAVAAHAAAYRALSSSSEATHHKVGTDDGSDKGEEAKDDDERDSVLW